MTLIEIASLFEDRKASLVELSGLDKDAVSYTHLTLPTSDLV